MPAEPTVPSAPPYAIGIDGGATHTTFVVIDQRLTELVRISAGPSNFRNVGLATMLGLLNQGIADVINQSGVRQDQITALGVGLAGVDSDSERAMIRQALEKYYPALKIVVDNDAAPALIGGSGQRRGIVVVSGTGSIVVGMDGQGKRARAGGWGYYLDRGSGYAIALQALLAVASAQDQTGPATGLTERIQTRLKIQSGRAMLDWLYTPGRRVDEIAALAAEPIAIAEQDTIAAGIIFEAAEALAAGVRTVASQLGLGTDPFALVTTGSVFQYSAMLRDLFYTSVRTILPNAVIVTKQRDAAVGAAMMAFHSTGLTLPGAQLSAEPPLRRPSEQRNRLTMTIGQRPTAEFTRLMNMEDRRVARAVETELDKITTLIDAIAARFSQGGRLLLAGAGTSGRLAVLDAAECIPTFNTTPEQVVGIIAGGEAALVHSIEGAEDSADQGRDAIIGLQAGRLDSVIGIAASGSTPFVQGVLREATARGALTGSIANAPNAPISALAEHPIALITGPEVIMGSTRLKAGSAQKMVLNMITTGVMLRIGKTFNNLMVDMVPSNIKLRERAKIMVGEATGLPLDAASALLARCDGEVKTAIAAHYTGVDPDRARQRLAEAGGNLNRIVQGPKTAS